MRTCTRFFPVLLICLMTLTLNTPLAAQGKKRAAKQRKLPPAMAPIKDVPGLPRVLLIGDSISIGYTLPVRELMKDKANVHRPPTNCGPTTIGLRQLEQWLGDKTWDVIHFNWGLHDLKYMGPNGENLQDPNDPKSSRQVPPEQYQKNLRQLVNRLRKTEAKLIWRSTTPVPEGAKGRVVGDSAKYNAIAQRIMQENGIEVHDLYSFVMPRANEIMQKANVHFTKEGSQALAEEVVRVIQKTLEK